MFITIASHLKNLCFLAVLFILGSADGGSIKIKGPKCTSSDEGNDESVNCGSSVLVNVEGGTKKLGELCTDQNRLLISILREDVDVDASNLKLEAYMSKVSECDEPTDISSSIPAYMEKMEIPSGHATINDNLTSDVSEFEFSSDVTEGKVCGIVRVIFVLKDDSGSEEILYGTKSVQLNITCPSNENMEDVRLLVNYSSTDIPTVEVGDRNPFGSGSEVMVDYGGCLVPKTFGCLYCGFDEGQVGVDDETWDTWQTVEGRHAWSAGWQREADVFEKLYRAGLCESMHMMPLLDGTASTQESLKLNRTYVPLPWAYDALKHLYNGRTLRCGMMVSVDLFAQCPDKDRTNNFAVFPVILNVNDSKVEEVREIVQLNWPDAETGVDPEDQDRSCTVLTNYMDNGKSAMIFPAPNITGFHNTSGMLYKRGSFEPLEFHDGRFWSSIVMFKLSFSNQDQCPSQCDRKYRQTQEAVGINKKLIDMVGRVINDTDDVIQGMRNTEFANDLEKYKDVSQLGRDLFTAFIAIPKANRFIGKLMMKMMKDDRPRNNDRAHGGRRQRPMRDNDHGPTSITPNGGECRNEDIDDTLKDFEDSDLRSGPYFLPNYEKGEKCWEEGCDYEASLKLCRENHGSIATINDEHENQMVRGLLQKFGEFHPDRCDTDFYWFYIGLKEEKRIDGRSRYHWEGGSNSTFKNWGGEEPNDYNGDSEECTFVIPETPGRRLSLDEGGPMWGDINCMSTGFQWPSNSDVNIRMVPICEVPMSRCQNPGHAKMHMSHVICENGGSCWDKSDGQSECVCFGGYTGSRCQHSPERSGRGRGRNRKGGRGRKGGNRMGGKGRDNGGRGVAGNEDDDDRTYSRREKRSTDEYEWSSLFQGRDNSERNGNNQNQRSNRGNKRGGNNYGMENEQGSQRRNGLNDDEDRYRQPGRDRDGSRNDFENGNRQRSSGRDDLNMDKMGHQQGGRDRNENENDFRTRTQNRVEGESSSNRDFGGRQNGRRDQNTDDTGRRNQQRDNTRRRDEENDTGFERRPGRRQGGNEGRGEDAFENEDTRDFGRRGSLNGRNRGERGNQGEDDFDFNGNRWHNMSYDLDEFDSYPPFDGWDGEQHDEMFMDEDDYFGDEMEDNLWDVEDDMEYDDEGGSDFDEDWQEDDQNQNSNNFEHHPFNENKVMKNWDRKDRNIPGMWYYGKSGKTNMGRRRENNKWPTRYRGRNNNQHGGFGFFKDMLKCDNRPTCGRSSFMQEISNCICQSFWSRNSDPSGEFCQAIPKATRVKAVEVISMLMKGNGPAMPRNRTMLRQLKRLGEMWGKKFEKLVSMPYEREDTQMLLNMESDNLTDALTQWKDGGVSQPDLAAPTLFRDLLNGVLDSDALLGSSTEVVQMFQGLSHQNMKRCDTEGGPGDAPSKEEFCIAYRAKKLADQYKCPLIMTLKEHLNNHDLGLHERNVLTDNIKNLGGVEGGRGSCSMRKESDTPIIWRKHMGNIVKGSFCEMDGEWYWSKIATCGGDFEEPEDDHMTPAGE